MEQSELVRRVNKLYTDNYEGDGPKNPPITVRLADLESSRDGMEEKVNKIESKIDKGFWLLVSTLIAALLQIGIAVAKH